MEAPNLRKFGNERVYAKRGECLLRLHGGAPTLCTGGSSWQCHVRLQADGHQLLSIGYNEIFTPSDWLWVSWQKQYKKQLHKPVRAPILRCSAMNSMIDQQPQ